ISTSPDRSRLPDGIGWNELGAATACCCRRSILKRQMPAIVRIRLAAGSDSGAARVDDKRVDRTRSPCKYAVALCAIEAQVGRALGQGDEPNCLAALVEHLDAVERRAVAPAAPQIAVDVDAETVGRFILLAADEHASVLEPGPVPDDIEDIDGARSD